MMGDDMSKHDQLSPEEREVLNHLKADMARADAEAKRQASRPAPHHPCPICERPMPINVRYPKAVCSECIKRAVDESNRPLNFYNQSTTGGFMAVYVDTGEERTSHICFIDGIKCRADEAHLGGIVVSVM
jgi:hypothetical protein